MASFDKWIKLINRYSIISFLLQQREIVTFDNHSSFFIPEAWQPIIKQILEHMHDFLNPCPQIIGIHCHFISQCILNNIFPGLIYQVHPFLNYCKLQLLLDYEFRKSILFCSWMGLSPIFSCTIAIFDKKVATRAFSSHNIIKWSLSFLTSLSM